MNSELSSQDKLLDLLNKFDDKVVLKGEDESETDSINSEQESNESNESNESIDHGVDGVNEVDGVDGVNEVDGVDGVNDEVDKDNSKLQISESVLKCVDMLEKVGNRLLHIAKSLKTTQADEQELAMFNFLVEVEIKELKNFDLLHVIENS